MQFINSENGDFEEETPHPWWKRARIIMLVGALAGDYPHVEVERI
jgi:hypothetical protein